MKLDNTSPITLTILGSTLYDFERSIREYSEISELGNTTLYEEEGFKPFLVMVYDSEGNITEFMGKPTSYVGTYYLLPIGESIDECLIGNAKPRRVFVDVPIHKDEDWVRVRIILQDSRRDINLLYDVSSFLNRTLLNGKIDSQDPFYNKDIYK